MNKILVVMLLSISMPILANSNEYCGSIADSAKQIMIERLSGAYAKDMYESIDLDKNSSADAERLKLIIDRSFKKEITFSPNSEFEAKEFQSQEFILCIQSHRSKS